VSKKWIALALLLVLRTGLAREGSGAHGADIEADQNNVWFLGNDPIPYCLTIEAGSKLDRAEILKQIDEAFNDWNVFFRKHGYDKFEFGGGPENTRFGAEFKDRQPRKLSLQARKIDACGAPTRQLEFRFSSESGLKWSLDANHAFGAAVRGPYDHSTYRTGGTVWISTKLESAAERKHILLHELGHVFGMSHNSTYVMFEKPGRLIPQARAFKKADVLGIIESSSWRFMIWPGDALRFDSLEVTSGDIGVSSRSLPLLGGPAMAAAPFFGSNSILTYVGRGTTGHFKFTLSMGDGPRGKSLTGSFQRRYHQFETGPSLHTQWRRPDGTITEGRLYLEIARTASALSVAGGSKQIPLEGVFHDSRTFYPAVIEFPYGAVVKLFDPAVGAWFTLSSYPFEVTP
jgi:hypothetical protein